MPTYSILQLCCFSCWELFRGPNLEVEFAVFQPRPQFCTAKTMVQRVGNTLNIKHFARPLWDWDPFLYFEQRHLSTTCISGMIVFPTPTAIICTVVQVRLFLLHFANSKKRWLALQARPLPKQLLLSPRHVWEWKVCDWRWVQPQIERSVCRLLVCWWMQWLHSCRSEWKGYVAMHVFPGFKHTLRPLAPLVKTRFYLKNH